MLDNGKKEMEAWLEETVTRMFFRGHEVAQRLRLVQEYIGEGDLPDQAMLITWLGLVDEDEIYSTSRVVDKVLQLWGLITDRYDNAMLETAAI